jgi:hypothetical protein
MPAWISSAIRCVRTRSGPTSSRREAVLRAVRERDGFLVRSEGHDRSNGTEDLFLEARHPRSHTGDDGGLVEQSLPPATHQNLRSRLNRLGNDAIDVRRLALVDDRSEVDLAGGVAHGEVRCMLDERLGVLLDDALVDQVPPRGQANLPLMEERAPGACTGGGVDVDPRQDDVRVVATELEGDPLEHLAGHGSDLLAGACGSGEAHHVDERVTHHCLTSLDPARAGRGTDLPADRPTREVGRTWPLHRRGSGGPA